MRLKLGKILTLMNLLVINNFKRFILRTIMVQINTPARHRHLWVDPRNLISLTLKDGSITNSGSIDILEIADPTPFMLLSSMKDNLTL